MTLKRLYIVPADNFVGVWACRSILKQSGDLLPEKLIAIVLNIRNQRSHELLAMGIEVIEVSPTGDNEFNFLKKEPHVGVIINPPIENYALWDEITTKIIQKMACSTHISAVLLSCLGLEEGHDMPHLSKFTNIEREFRIVGEKRPFHILRISLLQQTMLHFSRMIQESGRLLLPTGSGKCAWVDIQDVAMCSLQLLSHPHSFNVWSLTGPDALNGEDLMESLEKSVGVKYGFDSVDPKLTERYLRYEFGDHGIALVQFFVEMFQMISNDKLHKTTSDVKQITGKSPQKVDMMFKEFSDLFKP